MQPIEIPRDKQETLQAILDALPPRSSQEREDDRTGHLEAAKLTFALTQTRNGASAFIKAAQQAMARRLSINAHEMKFSIAMLEEFNRIGPTWRPHLLAATSVFLQGSNSENNPAVQRGADALTRSA